MAVVKSLVVTARTLREVPATNEPTPIDPNVDINLEMSDDEIHSSLQTEWGDHYEQRFAAASRVVQEIFHNDQPLLKWFEERVGNHINVVRLADLVAMRDGNRPQKTAAPNTAEPDAQLKDFKKGGKHFDAWMAGDKKLNEQRIALYSRKHPGKIIL